MVQLIKKGGLRERANRSRSYQGSENTQSTLQPNRYSHPEKEPHKVVTLPRLPQRTEDATPPD